MNAELTVVKERPRLEIDEKFGFVLAVVAGILLTLAVGGWIILLANVVRLHSAFDTAEAQRYVQLGHIQAKIKLIEDKVDEMTIRFQRVENVTNQHSERISESHFLLHSMKRDLDRMRAGSKDGKSLKKRNNP